MRSTFRSFAHALSLRLKLTCLGRMLSPYFFYCANAIRSVNYYSGTRSTPTPLQLLRCTSPSHIILLHAYSILVIHSTAFTRLRGKQRAHFQSTRSTNHSLICLQHSLATSNTLPCISSMRLVADFWYKCGFGANWVSELAKLFGRFGAKTNTS